MSWRTTTRTIASEALAEARLNNEIRLVEDGEQFLDYLRRHGDSVAPTLRSYHLGVISFIPKPETFQGLVETMRSLANYWFEIVRLPGANVDA